jgi:hypothetical protein
MATTLLPNTFYVIESPRVSIVAPDGDALSTVVEVKWCECKCFTMSIIPKRTKSASQAFNPESSTKKYPLNVRR